MSSSPFLASNHGHPSFNPVKIGKNLHMPQEAAKNSKQPKPPDKPLMPYMRYSKKVWDEVRAKYPPELKIWEISKIVGQMWRDLPDEDKQDYIDAFEAEKLEYNETLKVYHNSPAYQAWISSLKSKENEERDSHNKQKNKKLGPHGLNSPQKSDARVSLQSVDSEFDDEDDYFSLKHLAAARFYRNHRLVSEIFNEALVPDVRSIVTNNRYQVLRRQVESLTMHQKKLDEELNVLEDRFQEKKRYLLDSSEKFTSEISKRFASKPVDDVSYQRMVDQALEQIRKDNTPRVDTNVTSAAPVLPNNSAEQMDVDKSDTTTADTNRSNGEDSHLEVAVPAAPEPSTDSIDSTHELHNLKENTSISSQE